jgi:hypothetical protein
MHSDWFNGIDILQGRWQHGEKVGYCYPSGLKKTLCKWEVYVPLVTKGLKKTYFLRSVNCKLLSDIRRISINGCIYFLIRNFYEGQPLRSLVAPAAKTPGYATARKYRIMFRTTKPQRGLLMYGIIFGMDGVGRKINRDLNGDNIYSTSSSRTRQLNPPVQRTRHYFD